MQDHPKKTKQVPMPVKIHSSKQLSAQSHFQAEASMPFNAQDPPHAPEIKQQRLYKKITSKDVILKQYPDVLEGLASSQAHHIPCILTPVFSPNKHFAGQYPYI